MASKATTKQQKRPNVKRPDVIKEDSVTKPDQHNWPRFHPLIPVSDLYMKALVENQILVIPNFWTATLCKTYVSFLSTLPLVTTPGKAKKGEALRMNDRYQVDDPDFAEKLWHSTALRDLVHNHSSSNEKDGMTEEEGRKLWGGTVIGLNPRIRIYRYRKGQFFDQHCMSTLSVCFYRSSTFV